MSKPKYITESMPERLPCSSRQEYTHRKKGKRKKERKSKSERGFLKNIK
jgi:hypothetical protein